MFLFSLNLWKIRIISTLMNKFYLLFLYVFLGIFMAACSDEPLMDGPSVPPYEGGFKELTLGVEGESLVVDSAMCYMLYEDDVQFRRKCYVAKKEDKTLVTFDKGLADGIYRLLYFEYTLPKPEGENGEIKTRQYGMGCRIRVLKGIAKMIDSFDKTLRMTGSGTEDDPYIVSCAPHLYNLTLEIGDFYEYEKFIGAHFRQVADISLADASYYCKHEEGWTPIGNHVYPFVGFYDGDGHKITDIYSHQGRMVGVGLFGHISESTIKNLTVENADIYGVAGVGGIVGSMVSLSGERTSSLVNNCSVRNSTIKGSATDGDINKETFSVGGIVGLIDMYTIGAVSECRSVNNTIMADYNAGGIVGGSSAYSLTSIDLCENNSSVTAGYAGVGGIIGVADTLSVTTSTNLGRVSGAEKYTGAPNTMGRGVGGICGGAGVSWFSGCENKGAVKGNEGVGGIVGSTRLSSTLFNTTYLRYCMNSGNIEASGNFAGGLCGESQFGCFGSANSGSVKGQDYVGGIVGYTSLSVVHNSLNNGEVNGRDYVAGITAKSDMGAYAVCQNYGKIEGTGSMTAGIVGLTGNHTILHYCANNGAVTGNKTPVGGIVGEIGDPREWSALNITEVVFGSVEIIASFIGPTFAAIEHFNKGAKVVLEIVELTAEGILKIPSSVLYGIGVHHLQHPHHIETLVASIDADMKNRMEKTLNEIQKVRLGAEFTVPTPYVSQPLTGYADYIEELADLISGSEQQNEKFNERINEVMHERAEEIQLDNENKETIYTIVGTISLVVTAGCAIAATVATGGTAGFIAAGTVAGVVGGINSICKGAADYTDNVIILSQCVNTAQISCSNISGDKVGGLAGRIHDRGCIYDCLNTGKGPEDEGGSLVGSIGKDYEVTHCLSLYTESCWDGLFGDKEVSLSESNGVVSSMLVSPENISSVGYFKNKGWSIGANDSRWTIPATGEEGKFVFPVPYKSEMMK